jgi:hypothetical protein
MFKKSHSIETKEKISIRLSKRPVSLYSLDNIYLKGFLNQRELSDYLKLHKTTISRFLKSGKLLLNKYYLRPGLDD